VFYVGLAGALYAGFVRFLGPDIAGAHHTFDMTMYMLVGGLGTLAGPLLGALAVPWIEQTLQFLQDYRFIVFGPLLIVLVIFLPHGVVGTWLGWSARRRARAAATTPADTATQATTGRTATPATGGRHA
jgi:branched-chain amino acid transport system permease protein